MTNTVAYDVRRTLTSKSLLVIVAIVILISLAVIPFIRSATSPSGISSQSAETLLEYQDSGGYHFFVYAFNGYGDGLSGAITHIRISASNGEVYSTNITTNSTGFGSYHLTLPTGVSAKKLSFSIRYPSGGLPKIGSYSFLAQAPGEVYTIASDFGAGPVSPIADKSNSTKTDALVVYEGPYGAEPSGYSVHYEFGNLSSTASLNFSEGVDLGPLSGFVTSFKVPSAPNNTQSAIFWITNSTGGLVAYSAYPASTFRPVKVAVEATAIVSSFTSGILSFFIPLMAVLVSYTNYGKDRVTGTIESILTRPVTRRGLAFGRYVSVVLGLCAAIALTLAAIDLTTKIMVNSLLSGTFIFETFGSLAVEVAGFVGIMYLLAHLVKGTGALIGGGVMIFVVLDFFWSLITFAVSDLLGYASGSAGALRVSITADFFNIAHFYALVGDYQSKSYTGAFGGSTAINPASYGITPVTLVLTAALWIAIPLAAFVYLATRRD